MDEATITNISEENVNKLPRKRNTCLYFFEVLACCMIIFIHCEFPGILGIFLSAAARFGVPLFFAVSGFYLYRDGITKEEVRSKLKKRIIKVSLLLCFSFLLYFTLGLILSIFRDGVVSYLFSTFHYKRIIMLLLCNTPLTDTINWYLIALISSYLIIYLFPNLFIKNKYFVYIVSSLSIFWIIFNIIINQTKPEIFGYSLTDGDFYRSWYTNGLIFICLGIVIKRNISSILEISTKKLIIILISSFVLMISEHFTMVYLLGGGILYYIGNISVVVSMIGISAKHPDLFSKSKLLTMKGNFTMFVYIFHVAIMIILSIIIDKLGINNLVVNYFKPIVVLLLSLVIAIGFNFLFEFIKDQIKLKNETKSEIAK